MKRLQLVLSDLERQIINLLRIHRVMTGSALRAVFPPEDDTYGKENRALSIALSRLVHEAVVYYDPDSDIYKATLMDERSDRSIRAMMCFLSLHEDKDAAFMLQGAITKGDFDLCCPEPDGAYEYFFFVDSKERAAGVTRQAKKVLAFSEKASHVHFLIAGADEKLLSLCHTEGVDNKRYVLENNVLRRVYEPD